MSPELFIKNAEPTQESDIYAVGIIFYRLVVRDYPMKQKKIEDQQKKLATLKVIKKPSQIKDNDHWDLLSKMLDFDPLKRISAEDALQHPFFTGPNAINDFSQEQHDLAIAAALLQQDGDESVTDYDTEPSFIVTETAIKPFIQEIMLHNKTLKKDKSSKKLLDRKISQNKPPRSKKELKSTQIQQTNVSKFRRSSQSQESVHSNSSNQGIDRNAIQASLNYIVTQQQIQVEVDLLAFNKPMEQLLERLNGMEGLSLLDKDILCVNITNTIERDEQIAENEQITQIIDTLIKNIDAQPVQTVYPIYIRPVISLLYACILEGKEIQAEQSLLKYESKALDNKNEDVLGNSVEQMRLITQFYGERQAAAQPNPLREVLFQNQMFPKLMGILYNNQTKDKDINGKAGITIGMLFKAFPVPDSLKPNLIGFLKQLSGLQNPFLSSNSLLAIAWMAEKTENHDVIASDQFINVLYNILADQMKEEQQPNAILVLTNLYIFGVDEVRGELHQELLTNQISELTMHQNINISALATNLFELLNFENMTEEEKEIAVNNEAILKDIQGRAIEMNEEERLKMILEEKSLTKIYDIIMQTLKEEMSWVNERLLQLACDTVSALLNNNFEAIQIALSKDGIVDALIAIIDKFQITQLKAQFINPISNLMYMLSFEQKEELIEKGMQKVIFKSLQSNDPGVVLNSVNICCDIVNSSSQQAKEGEINKLKEVMDKEGITVKIFDILVNNQFQDAEIIGKLAISIGLIFKANPLPAQTGHIVIQLLKQQIVNPDPYIYINSLYSIACLSENQENHQLIIAATFFTPNIVIITLPY
ncbi:MAG: hypothetical protein EZS28_031085, partial [Streblomastix strix]